MLDTLEAFGKKEIKTSKFVKVKFLTDDAILYIENSKEFMHACTYTNPVKLIHEFRDLWDTKSI